MGKFLCKLRNRIRCIESNWPMDTYCTYRSELIPIFQVFQLAKYDKSRIFMIIYPDDVEQKNKNSGEWMCDNALRFMIYNLGPPKCSTEVRLTYVERERERGEGDNIQYTYDCRTRSKQSGDANFENTYIASSQSCVRNSSQRWHEFESTCTFRYVNQVSLKAALRWVS